MWLLINEKVRFSFQMSSLIQESTSVGLAIITGLLKRMHCNERRVYFSSSVSIPLVVFSAEVLLCVPLCGVFSTRDREALCPLLGNSSLFSRIFNLIQSHMNHKGNVGTPMFFQNSVQIIGSCCIVILD